MANQRKFCIYLAGPITGCNQAQVRDWRNEVRNKYSKRCEFLDPAEQLLSDRAIPHEVVSADIRAIEHADGVLVNMWRESIGTAISVVHAQRTGRPVVVSDPNRLQNRALTFYVDAVEDRPLKGMNTLLDLLRAESWQVITRSGNGETEEFRRGVLMASIEDACRRAGRDDIVVPRLAFPLVIERLKVSHRRMRERISTTEVSEAVAEVLGVLEEHPEYAGMSGGILREWQRRQDVEKRTGASSGVAGADERDVEVPVYTPKAHSTIWGGTVKEVGDVGSGEAREVLHSIAGSVAGITRIVLTRFERGRLRDRCQVRIRISTTPFVIEGELFDKGTKGTLQRFQIWVQFNAERAAVAEAIEARLRRQGRWAR